MRPSTLYALIFAGAAYVNAGPVGAPGAKGGNDKAADSGCALAKNQTRAALEQSNGAMKKLASAGGNDVTVINIVNVVQEGMRSAVVVLNEVVVSNDRRRPSRDALKNMMDGFDNAKKALGARLNNTQLDPLMADAQKSVEQSAAAGANLMQQCGGGAAADGGNATATAANATATAANATAIAANATATASDVASATASAVDTAINGTEVAAVDANANANATATASDIPSATASAVDAAINGTQVAAGNATITASATDLGNSSATAAASQCPPPVTVTVTAAATATAAAGEAKGKNGMNAAKGGAGKGGAGVKGAMNKNGTLEASGGGQAGVSAGGQMNSGSHGQAGGGMAGRSQTSGRFARALRRALN